MSEVPVVVITLFKRAFIHGESLMLFLEKLSNEPDFDEESVEYRVIMKLIRNLMQDYELDANGIPVESKVEKL